MSLRMQVRRALNNVYGAPEIAWHVLSKTSLDPVLMWVLAALRLWKSAHAWTEPSERAKHLTQHSRVLAFRKWATRFGWQLTSEHITVMDGAYRVNLEHEGRQLRQEVVTAFRRTHCMHLVKRRPNTYLGLIDCNTKMHKDYLRNLSPHASGTILKIWQGAAMTRAQHHKMDPTKSSECDCGHHYQDVHHLVFDCPLSPELPMELLPWAALPPAYSSALLAPFKATTEQRKIWPLLCDRAVRILSGNLLAPEALDWKGHLVTPDRDLEYSFCVRCFVTRKMADARHIAARPCKGLIMQVECSEGAYTAHKGHILRLLFKPWKRAARRPAFCCVKCDAWAWPSSRFSPCPF